MTREKIFKKMKTWNNVFVVYGIITTIFSLFGLVKIFTTDWESVVEIQKQSNEVLGIRSAGLTVDSIKPSTFMTVVSIIIIGVTIYTIYMAIKNKENIQNKEKVNNLPYIIYLILLVYGVISSFVNSKANFSSLTSMSAGLNSMPEGGLPTIAIVIIVIMIGIIGLMAFLNIAPSVKMLRLNKKIDKLEEDERVEEV